MEPQASSPLPAISLGLEIEHNRALTNFVALVIVLCVE
jgi:hypothetical protein